MIGAPRAIGESLLVVSDRPPSERAVFASLWRRMGYTRFMRYRDLPPLLILGVAALAAPSLAGPPPPTKAAPPASSAKAAPSAKPAAGPAPGTVKVALPLDKYRLDNGLEVILHEDHRTP